MSTKTVLVAIGGGELEEASDILDKLLELIEKKRAARVVVMTVATEEPNKAGAPVARRARLTFSSVFFVLSSKLPNKETFIGQPPNTGREKNLSRAAGRPCFCPG